MSQYASVALFRRGTALQFKPPRRERHADESQARKAASRYWAGNIQEPDRLTKIMLVRKRPGAAIIDIAERTPSSRRDKPWAVYSLDAAKAFENPALAAALAEIGVSRNAAPAPLPDILEINGVIYRREI